MDGGDIDVISMSHPSPFGKVCVALFFCRWFEALVDGKDLKTEVARAFGPGPGFAFPVAK